LGKVVKEGDRAPAFSLQSGGGGDVSIGDFLGKRPIVIFFYPKDDTAVCIREACEFRDRYEELTAINGAEVIGISSDPPESHVKFSRQLGLPYTLLSDKGGRVRKLYGVPKTLGILPGRTTYVIDAEGIVRRVFSSQLDYRKHVQAAIDALSGMKG